MKRALMVVMVAALMLGCDRQAPPTQTIGPVVYVASVHGQPFHKKACASAKRIKSDNLETYSTRTAALNDGHRACRRCKP